MNHRKHESYCRCGKCLIIISVLALMVCACSSTLFAVIFGVGDALMFFGGSLIGIIAAHAMTDACS